MINLRKGMIGYGGATIFGESQHSGTWHPIHVVAQDKYNWKTHPKIAKVEPHWKSWVYGIRPLANLEWDLGDFRWKQDCSRLSQFSYYNTKLGRTIQMQWECPLHNGWQTLAILDEVLDTF